MQHQDWNPIVLNNTDKSKRNLSNKIVSQKKPDEEQKVIVPPSLGKIISQARNASNKTRKILDEKDIRVLLRPIYNKNLLLLKNKEIGEVLMQSSFIESYKITIIISLQIIDYFSLR